MCVCVPLLVFFSAACTFFFVSAASLLPLRLSAGAASSTTQKLSTKGKCSADAGTLPQTGDHGGHGGEKGAKLCKGNVKSREFEETIASAACPLATGRLCCDGGATFSRRILSLAASPAALPSLCSSDLILVQSLAGSLFV